MTVIFASDAASDLKVNTAHHKFKSLIDKIEHRAVVGL